MSTMQVFYKNIKTASSESTGTYLSTLEKLTHLEPTQMKLMVTDLSWIDWSAPALQINANH
jgi:hypothetical protein